MSHLCRPPARFGACHRPLRPGPVLLLVALLNSCTLGRETAAPVFAADARAAAPDAPARETTPAADLASTDLASTDRTDPGAAAPRDAAAPDAARSDAADVASDLRANPSAPDASTTAFFDDCFASLPAPAAGMYSRAYREVQDKASGDGRVRLRMAIEAPPDVGGTSGTTPFSSVVRFAAEIDGARICVPSPAPPSYLATHHNYDDEATVNAEGKSYRIALHLSYGPPIMRSESLTGYANGVLVIGPLPLIDAGCTGSGPAGKCIFRPAPAAHP